MLQKYDLELIQSREDARAKFDLDRDAALHKLIAAVGGVKITDTPKAKPPSESDEQRRTMTRQDIMRNYRQSNV